MANETLLDPTPAAPAAGSSAAGGDSTATPNGETTLLDPQGSETPNPNGSSQDSTKPPTGSEPPAAPKPGEKQASAAPESYQAFKVPDGITLNPTVLDNFSKTAKELNLSQESAQKLIDLQTQVAQATTAQSIADFEKMKADWKQQTLKDLGADANKQLALAAKVREKFVSPELMNVLRDSGLANHPGLVKLFISVGKAISEDSFAEGKQKLGNGDKTVAEIMYPSLPK